MPIKYINAMKLDRVCSIYVTIWSSSFHQSGNLSYDVSDIVNIILSLASGN